MKKIITIVLAIAMLSSVALFVGCSKTTECELCGETKKCKKVEFEGEKGWACEDCEKGLEALEDMADALS